MNDLIETVTSYAQITDVFPNPDNPRNIKDDQFKKLQKSIEDFPEMLELRPLVVDENNIIIGGNMRYEALKSLGHKTVKIIKVVGLSAEQKRQFIIKDNLSFGEWDFDMLANSFDGQELIDFGFNENELKFSFSEDFEEEKESKSESTNMWFLNIRCDDERHAQSLYEKLVNQGLDVKIVT